MIVVSINNQNILESLFGIEKFNNRPISSCHLNKGKSLQSATHHIHIDNTII